MITAFLSRAVVQAVPLLYGCSGEILIEKSGLLNLGIPGIMYMGAISGVIGSFFYERSVGPDGMTPFLTIAIPLLCCLLASLLMGLLFAFLTVSLKANQNVTGLAMTTFGTGVGNFFGGTLFRLVDSDATSISLSATSEYFQHPLPFASAMGPLEGLFSFGFMAYLAIIIALLLNHLIYHSRWGLELRACGENPATADAAGINVTAYRYGSALLGSMIAGLGGLYYIMDYASGVWSNNAFGDRGWLAIALVIFCFWRPNWAVLGSFVFGAFFIIHNYIPNITMAQQELIKMAPYVVTILVLIFISARDSHENQPPSGLGQNYFRENR